MADTALETPLVPAGMLAAYVYCPRLAILQWVDREFAHNVDTLEGAIRHSAVDRPGSRLRLRKMSEGPEDALQAESVLQIRSVDLSDEDLGLVAKIDLVEAGNGGVKPVETKKGKRPHVEGGAHDPERVQVCAQGLLLRAHGYRCNSGMIYFAGSNERIEVPFGTDLVALTRTKLAEIRQIAETGTLPPPLEDSPKCVRCSMLPICLPDETRFLLREEAPAPRPLIPAGDHLFPLYAQHPGSVVRKKGDLLEVWHENEKLGEMRTREISQLVLMGGTSATEAVYRELLARGKPIVHLSTGGWLYGVTEGLPLANVRLRREQYRAADDPQRCLGIARSIVTAKLANQRTFLRRNARGAISNELLDGMRNAGRAALRAENLAELRGHEGNGARLYFRGFASLLVVDTFRERFDLEGRNRRPPRDPVNALLSFAYAMLAREWVTVCRAVAFDPYLGFYHAPHHGRPSLALDLMEAFRPLCADSVVVRAINNGEVGPGDFVERVGSVNLSESGRRRFLRSFEDRLAQEITHPIFGYRISYRRVFEVEARLLARYLVGEIPTYEPLRTR